MVTSIDFLALARQFDHAGAQAIVLMGSHARGEAGPFSDIDLVRFVGEGSQELDDKGTHLIDGRLVVVSDVAPAEAERAFFDPQAATEMIEGLRGGQVLIDREASFANIQARAKNFVWDEGMQQRANIFASQQMVGWVEEVHKGLEGLRRNDIGRLLNANFGLSWGLARIMQVQRGILLKGDNAFFTQIETVMGANSEWVRLWKISFGIEAYSLEQGVEAGLKLYRLMAEMLNEIFLPEDRLKIDATAQIIEAELKI
jgi:hypothetical protein